MEQVVEKIDGRMAKVGERKTYDIQKLWDSNREILRLITLGWKDKEIAEKLGVTTQTVSNTRNSTLGKRQLSLMRGARDAEVLDVQRKVDSLLPKAFQVYEEILESEGISKLKKATADTIVKELGGHAAPTKVDIRSQSLVHAKLEVIKQRAIEAREAMKKAGILVLEGEVVNES